MSNAIDLTGQKFNLWTVLKEDESKYKAHWFCKCICGKVKSVRGDSLKNNYSKSCGCKGIGNKSMKSRETHQLSSHPLYVLWGSIRDRTSNKNNLRYSDYGGRGIIMYPIWKQHPEEFISYILKHLGPRPDKNHSIDRINNQEGYMPGNIKWASRIEQNSNTRTNRYFKVKDESELYTMSQLARKVGLKPDTVKHRLNRSFNTPSQAFDLPEGIIKEIKQHG